MINCDTIQDPPPVLRGFEHVTRYWDRYTAHFAAKILIVRLGLYPLQGHGLRRNEPFHVA
jgi:hypothetical protein